MMRANKHKIYIGKHIRQVLGIVDTSEKQMTPYESPSKIEKNYTSQLCGIVLDDELKIPNKVLVKTSETVKRKINYN